ncbi:hypothetical protein SADUNF_Sadunf11G0021000 [Salix dunnii]|uniref:Uncharacterized protein n=1 Tax=Salix dunnii TaxID=1413687 RepID=A0A835MSW0_9ROSI|nr:hypothetical protein SADUNF_Sadunf11G0021000 [Salix dunnii]
MEEMVTDHTLRKACQNNLPSQLTSIICTFGPASLDILFTDYKYGPLPSHIAIITQFHLVFNPYTNN